MASLVRSLWLWVLALAVVLVAAEVQPRSGSLLTVLTSLEDEIPTCVVR
jgi:hypothetical protein